MLSNKIRELRKQNRYSQEQIARKLGLTQGAISQWENGVTSPSPEQLIQLAEIFSVTVNELMEQQEQDDACLIRERLRRDPAYRMLFNTAKYAKPEHLRAAAVMLKALEGEKDD